MSPIPPTRRRQAASCGTLMLALALLSSAVAMSRTVKEDPLEPARSALRLLQFDRAIERLSALARAGNPRAEHLLALMYLNGVGTAPDAARARTLLQSAAKHGLGVAAYVLAAELEQDGEGAPGAAHAWLERSAKLGYPRASEALKSGRPLLDRDVVGAVDPSLLSAWVMSCAIRGDAAALRRLGAPAAQVHDDFGRGALSHAAQADKPDAAGTLIDLGADTGAVDRYGTTALMLAAEQPGSAVLKLLLEHGVDPEAADIEKRTALFYAARADRPDSLERLLHAGAAIGHRDVRGYTALDVALTMDAQAAAGELRSQGALPSVVSAQTVRPAGKFDASRPGDIYRGSTPLALAVARDDCAESRNSLRPAATSTCACRRAIPC